MFEQPRQDGGESSEAERYPERRFVPWVASTFPYRCPSTAMANRERSVSEATGTVTDRDRRALERARSVGRLLDESIRIPVIGYRIGLDPILGILPVSGDAAAAVGSMYIVLQGFRIGVPRETLVKMAVLVGAEFLIGSVPVLGTLFDAVVKVNTYNVSLLESHLDSPAA